MIINDINYLETSNEEVFGGLTFTKNLNSTQTNTINFFNTTNINETANIYKNVVSKTNVKGQSALVLADVEAVGADGVVELETSVLTIQGQLSSIGFKAVSATN